MFFKLFVVLFRPLKCMAWLLVFFVAFTGAAYAETYEVKGKIIHNTSESDIDDGARITEYRVRIKQVGRRNNLVPFIFTATLRVNTNSDAYSNLNTLNAQRGTGVFTVRQVNMRYEVIHFQRVRDFNSTNVFPNNIQNVPNDLSVRPKSY